MLSSYDITPFLLYKLRDAGPYALIGLPLLGAILYGLGLVIYRLLFHPLRRIPGPKLAAATYWYEFYQDVVLDGNFVKAYPGLHAKYGPVVRVSPDRVHVSDPEFYHEIYNRKSPYLKDPNFALAGGISESLPMLINPEVHRKRRKLVNPMFSQTYLRKVAPLALNVIKNALSKARDANQEMKPLHIQRLYTGITVDIIMQICFDKQLHLVDSTEEEPPFLRVLRTFSEGFFLTKHFPILTNIATGLPDKAAEWLVPGYVSFRKQCAAWIEEVKERHANGKYCTDDGRKTLFDLLLLPSMAEDPSDLPPLTPEILVDEAFAFCFAGTHTTSISLSMGTYYLLRDPVRLRKLLDELKDVPRNSEGLIEYADVYNLPYLTACIKEALRLSSPVPGILPREVPPQGVDCCGHYLPGGTIASMTVRMVHDNDEVFPDPAAFVPERWMGPNGRDAEKWLVVFSKGPRQCIGQDLAWMELYLILSNFFSQLDMSLFETDEFTTQWKDNGNVILNSYVKVMVDKVKEIEAA